MRRRAVIAGAGSAVAVAAVGAVVVLAHHDDASRSPGAALRAALMASVMRDGAVPPDLADFVPAAHVTVEAVTVVHDGKTWRFGAYRNRFGGPCEVTALDGRLLFNGCAAPRFTHRVLWMGAGGAEPRGHPLRWAEAWVAAQASPQIVRVDVVTTSCAIRRLARNRTGEFLAVFDRHDIASGVRPYLVRGYDATGALVVARRVRILEPDPATFTAQLNHPPRLRGACAPKRRA